MSGELNGIIVLDKPAGISSAALVARVKRVVGAKKVGHSGTLDPFATGVMVCCLNRATRLSRFLLEGDKTYEAEMVLGISTDTQDATGRVMAEHPIDGITAASIHALVPRFIGDIEQIPPAYSALKHQGTPLYKLARKGIAVRKPARPVRIHQLTILSIDLPVVRLRVSCSAGTYIRTLCADMGAALGCGAHLKRLRRTASCGFDVDTALTLETLCAYRDEGRLEKAVIPMHAALPRMPAVTADDGLAQKIRNGKKLASTDFADSSPLIEGTFKVIDSGGQLIAVLEATLAGSYIYCCVFSV